MLLPKVRENPSEEELKLINCLPSSKKVDQRINKITYNFVNNTCLYYLNEFFEFAPNCRIDTRNSFFKLKDLFCKNKAWDKKQFPWPLYLEQLA